MVPNRTHIKHHVVFPTTPCRSWKNGPDTERPVIILQSGRNAGAQNGEEVTERSTSRFPSHSSFDILPYVEHRPSIPRERLLSISISISVLITDWPLRKATFPAVNSGVQCLWPVRTGQFCNPLQSCGCACHEMCQRRSWGSIGIRHDNQLNADRDTNKFKPLENH